MRIGIDLVEHQDIVNRDERFIKRILTQAELNYYSTITNKKRITEYLSSRFACKEAIFKCYKKGLSFQDITILNEENGAPYALILNKKTELQISLSHTEHYSVAVAILPSCDDD